MFIIDSMFKEIVIRLKKHYMSVQDATIIKEMDDANLRHFADNSRLFSKELGLIDFDLQRQ